MDLALNNLQRLICHKTQQTKPNHQKVVLDSALLNTQRYMVRIKGKVGQSREWSSTLPIHHGEVAIEKGSFRSPSTKGRQLYFNTVLLQRWILHQVIHKS